MEAPALPADVIAAAAEQGQVIHVEIRGPSINDR